MIKKHLLFLSFFVMALSVSSQPVASLTIRDTSGPLINQNIYGHFAEDLGTCIYGGIWSGDHFRMEVVNALKKLHIPLLRWPGGCFADNYHWRDGIGPRRKRTVNASWGMLRDDNSFGTHEFLQLCDLLGCEPYIGANVGSGSPEEMEDWLEYLNYGDTSELTELRRANGHPKPFNVTYWGVGNESWGCGGSMRPEYYADQYRRYARFCKAFGSTPMKLIASGANDDDYNWTDVLMKTISLRRTWGLSLHYYALPGEGHASARDFAENGYFGGVKACLKMEELINHHSSIMDKYDPAKKVALVVDEWGIATDPEPGTNPEFHYQQSSLRDALVAGTTLNIFNNHTDRVKMANLAQAVNVVQALILTDKDRMLLTPTYHVFDLYKVHQNAHSLVVQLATPDYVYDGQRIPAVNASASRDSNGVLHLSLVNLDPHTAITVHTHLAGVNFKQVRGRVLTSAQFNDINTFEQPNKVVIQPFTGARKEGEELVVTLPSKSVVVLELTN